MNQSGGAHCRRRKAWTHRNYEPRSSPFLHWKFEDDKTTGVVEASARKLAAGLWQLRFSETSWGQDLKFNSGPSDPSQPQPLLESSLSYPKCALDRGIKWGPGCSKESDDIYRFYGHMKLLKDCQVTTGSIVSTLNAEIAQARLCICELEAKRQSFKKKVKHLLRTLDEERISWKSRARQKKLVIEELKEEVGRERKCRQWMENLNTNLVNQLAGAKLSAEQFIKKYEEERKRRKLMEEISNELAEQMGEDKAEVEALKRESMKILQEVEEEREMLQIVELLREERVQMKLMDAKLALEDKYCQLNKLITDVETFLRSRFGTLDMMELRKAESILQAVKSLNIHDIEEFSYVPLKSDGICEGSEREIEPWICHTPSRDSKAHPMRPEDKVYNSSCLQEDARGWDNMSHAEDQGSCDSAEGGDPLVLSEGERRLSNGNTSSLGTNSQKALFEHETRHRDSVGQWIPMEVSNPHITRGMKGCIKWPRAIQQNGSKAKLLEAKIESQKSQLRHVIKQKLR